MTLVAWQIDEGFLSAPEAIEFPTENGKTAFLNFYAAKNKDFKLPSGHKSPLLVKIHGGPTSQAGTGFNLGYQFWTSRGQPEQQTSIAADSSCMFVYCTLLFCTHAHVLALHRRFWQKQE